MNEIHMAILGAIVATVVMTMMILFGDKMGLMPSNYNMLTDGLGSMMNKMMSFIPKEMGYLVHFIIGIGLHPWLHGLIFGGLSLNIFLSGVLFALIFGVMMVAMLPMLNVPADADKMKMTMGILMAHVVYGVLFVAF